jgi:hypothetical protein
MRLTTGHTWMRAGMIAVAILALAAGAVAQNPAGQGQSPKMQDKLTMTGKLTRAMAAGGETTGWMLELDTEATIEGKTFHSIEIDYPKVKKLEKLVDQQVAAEGKLAHRQGVESEDRWVLEVTSIKSASGK